MKVMNIDFNQLKMTLSLRSKDRNRGKMFSLVLKIQKIQINFLMRFQQNYN